MKDLPKKAYFRCDASIEVGVGHVMRCLTLANALYDKGWICSFLTAKSSIEILPDLKKSPYNILPIDYKPEQSDLMVIDHYGLDQSYHSQCRQWSKKIMVVDDLANRQYDGDILLDQTYGRIQSDYTTRVPPNCLILTGERYILLRSQFLDKRKKAEIKRKVTKKVENILINFGSTNPKRIIQKTLKALNHFTAWGLQINIVCGSLAQDLEELKNLSREMTQNTNHAVSLHTDVKHMAQFMLEADLAIGAGGTTSWERACMGLPTLLIEIADNQSLVSKNLSKNKVVHYIGRIDQITSEDIINSFQNLCESSDLLSKMSQLSFTICDGLGVSRVVDYIEKR